MIWVSKPEVRCFAIWRDTVAENEAAVYEPLEMIDRQRAHVTAGAGEALRWMGRELIRAVVTLEACRPVELGSVCETEIVN